MGCVDSQPSEEASQGGTPLHNTNKPPFRPIYDDGPTPNPEHLSEQPLTPNNKHKSLTKSRTEEETPYLRQKIKPVQRENTLKVRKAKELRNKESHQKFTSHIVAKARQHLESQYPQIPKSPPKFAKPVVEYSPQRKRGAILPEEGERRGMSRWERPVGEEGMPSPSLSLGRSYVGVNQSSKTSFRQWQIQTRLESIRNGRLEQSQSGKIVRINNQRYPQPDSSYALQL